jgi:ParB family chromosome partitioning protein
MSTGSDKQRKALGKGLSALLPARSTAAAPVPAATEPKSKDGVLLLAIDAIEPNPLQPRRSFPNDRLQELAASIRSSGIIQPLTVRKHLGTFQLVAGERRWRAAKLADLTHVPVLIQDVADKQMLMVALIENIQREDLNPIELATAYERLGRELGLSQDEIARQTGKDRATIANTVRLLKLPQSIQSLVAEHRLSMGHARAILGLPDAHAQVQLAEEAVARGLSVRDVEARVQEAVNPRPPRDGSATSDRPTDPNVKAALEQLERTLGTRVRIVAQSPERGRIEIDYYSQAELDRLFQQIVGS